MRMQNHDKTFFLKTAKQLVLRCSEYTPPEVKNSDLNMKIAKASLAIQEVVDLLKVKKINK